MKKILTLIFINIVFALFQTAFFPTLFGKQALINWVLALGFAWLLVDAPITALKSVFVGGVILDILLGTRLGLSSLIMTMGVYLLILVRNYLFRGIIPHLVVGTIVAYIYSMIILAKGNSVDLPLLVLAFVSAFISYLASLVFKQILASRS